MIAESKAAKPQSIGEWASFNQSRPYRHGGKAA